MDCYTIGHWIRYDVVVYSEKIVTRPKGALETISDKSLTPAISASITATYNQQAYDTRKNNTFIQPHVGEMLPSYSEYQQLSLCIWH